MGHRVWDQVVTLNVGFMERLPTIAWSFVSPIPDSSFLQRGSISLIEIDLAGLHGGRHRRNCRGITRFRFNRRRRSCGNRGAGEQSENEGVEIASTHK